MKKKKKKQQKSQTKNDDETCKKCQKTNFSNRLLIDIEPMHLVAIFTEISLF